MTDFKTFFVPYDESQGFIRMLDDGNYEVTRGENTVILSPGIVDEIKEWHYKFWTVSDKRQDASFHPTYSTTKRSVKL